MSAPDGFGTGSMLLIPKSERHHLHDVTGHHCSGTIDKEREQCGKDQCFMEDFEVRQSQLLYLVSIR